MEVAESPAGLLLRVLRRKTSFEESDPNEILSAEFELGDGTPDLRPSVYDVNPRDVVAIVTQHSAGAGLDRVTAPREHPDLRPIHDGDVAQTPSDCDWFSEAKTAHRELILTSRDQLLRLIARLRECNRYPVTKDAVVAYLRLARDQPDWRNFFAYHAKGPRWQKLAGG